MNLINTLKYIKNIKGNNTFSWANHLKPKQSLDVVQNVANELKRLYRKKLLPLEERYHFHEFHSAELNDADFDAKPIILLIGQYSTGKTSLIRYLLQRDFPGMRIGPEPTTDRFIAIMHSEHEGVIPGNVVVTDKNKPFNQLKKFGTAFLNRFQCSTLNAPLLKEVTIIDTPGILSGEKQRPELGYYFTGVLEFLAQRVDRIIVLFDAHKLDISSEFRRSMEALIGYEDKIRIILNKADLVEDQELMRVYGALMWNLGKVLQTPEVARVYIGSFWDQPLRSDSNRHLFEAEELDLFSDIQSLPANATLRKLNDFIKRAQLAKIHAYIISEIHRGMPAIFSKDRKRKEIIQDLGAIFYNVQQQYRVLPGDLPDLKKMQNNLIHQNFSKFSSLRSSYISKVDNLLANDVPRLMEMLNSKDIKLQF